MPGPTNTQQTEHHTLINEIVDTYVLTTQASSELRYALRFDVAHAEQKYKIFFKFFIHLYTLTSGDKRIQDALQTTKEGGVVGLNERILTWEKNHKGVNGGSKGTSVQIVNTGLGLFDEYTKLLWKNGIVAIRS